MSKKSQRSRKKKNKAANKQPSPLASTQGVLEILDVREIRETDDERSAVFVAATENGVDSWFGREYLDMQGVDLKRYNRNPVFLDSHNREGTSDVIGRTEIKVENNQLIAKVFYANTEKALEVWSLVKDGFVKAVSVGYFPRKRKILDDGEEDELNGKTINGPATIAREWELFELSQVPVGADADALKRGLINENLTRDDAREIIDILETRFFDKENEMVDKLENENEAAEETSAEEGAETQAAAVPDVDEPVIDRRQGILDICPRGLEDVADELVLDGKTTVEEARAVFKKKLDQSRQTIGSPEADISNSETRKTDDEKPVEEKTADEVDKKVLKRGVLG